MAVGFRNPQDVRIPRDGSTARHRPWRRRSRTMTADAVRSTMPPPDRQPHRNGTAAIMVRLLRQSYAEVAPRAEEATRFFYAMLFAIAPDTRELFAANMEVQRSRFWRELVPFLHQLGRDHRKFGVLEQHYDAMGTALVTSLKQYAGAAWTPQVEKAWSDAYGLIAKTMQEAAQAEPGPAWW